MDAEILIVEQKPDVAELSIDDLAGAGFSVRTTDNGQDAMRWIEKKLPNLVVLDVRLPMISGLDVCRLIKSDPVTSGVLVIMVSSQSDRIFRVLAFELGADDYVVKPFSPRELVLRVQTMLH